MHNPERNFPYINENLSRSPPFSQWRVDARVEYWRGAPLLKEEWICNRDFSEVHEVT